MTEIVTALLGLIGSALGAGAGIMVSQKLTDWRLQQIEERLKIVDKHTTDIVKMQAEINELQHEIRTLKKEW